MKPTEILAQEHQVILKVLDCLEKMAEQSRSSGALDCAAARRAIDFFRTFADRCHHLKEEHRLFPVMVKNGFSTQDGPVAVMTSEHEQGRRHVGQMDEAIGALEGGDADAASRFAAAARGYVWLLRDHISKEDHCLFPMAEQSIGESGMVEVLQAFEKAEREDLPPGTHEKYLRLAAELCERYGVEGPPTECSGAGGCGHH